MMLCLKQPSHFTLSSPNSNKKPRRGRQPVQHPRSKKEKGQRQRQRPSQRKSQRFAKRQTTLAAEEEAKEAEEKEKEKQQITGVVN